MTGENLFWAYWYYQLPNYLLGALFWTCLGRFLLSLFILPNSTNYIWRWFYRLTDPVIAGVGYITPRYVLPLFMPLVAAFWLTIARVLLFFILTMAGLGPTVGAAGG